MKLAIIVVQIHILKGLILKETVVLSMAIINGIILTEIQNNNIHIRTNTETHINKLDKLKMPKISLMNS